MSSAQAPIVAPKTTRPLLGVEPWRPKRRPRNARWVLVGVAVAAVVALAYLRAGGPAAPPAADVPTRMVRVGTLEKILRLNGVTASKNQVTLIAPRLRGRRRSANYTLNLQEVTPAGSQVKKGDVLAQFDNQYMVNRIDDYEDRVIRQEARIRRSIATLDVKRKAHEQRIRVAKGSVDKADLNLKTIPVRSAIQTERYRLTREESEAYRQQLLNQTQYVDISESSELRRQQLDLKEAEVEHQRARVNLDKMLVRAPVAGLTVMLSLKRGTEMDQIKKGDRLRSGMPYMLIVDLRSMMLNAELSQVDSEVLRIGAPATVRVDAFPDLELPATVHSIGTIARANKRRGSAYVRNIPVRLSLERTDPRVIPNYSACADVVLESEENITIVPLECVFSDENSPTPFAFVKGAAGWQRRELELGLANNIDVAVHSGLAEGETVAAEQPEMLEQPVY